MPTTNAALVTGGYTKETGTTLKSYRAKSRGHWEQSVLGYNWIQHNLKGSGVVISVPLKIKSINITLNCNKTNIYGVIKDYMEVRQIGYKQR